MLSRIKEIFKEFGFVLYTRPYELNIVGLRSKSVESNSFDDEIHVLHIAGWKVELPHLSGHY